MTKNLRCIDPTESQIQCAIVEWANNTLTNEGYRIGDFLIKIPNEGKRSFYIGNKIKKEGLKKGVSDLFLAIPSLIFKVSDGTSCDKEYLGGLWLEVKTKRGKLSVDQKKWQERMIKAGYEAVVVRSVDEGIKEIKDYLGIK